MNKIKLNARDLSVESESEYFFDDQFSVPFDANLKEENNNNIHNGMSISNINDISQLCQSFSESCIYSDLDSSYQVFPDVLDDYIEGRYVKQENFMTSQSDREANISDSMIKSSNSHSYLLKDLLIKQSSRDYCITFEEKSNSPLNRKTFSSFTISSNLVDDNDDLNCTKVTWNQISKKNQNSLLKAKPIAKESSEENSTTWRQLKDNASNKVMSWNKLKNSSKSGDVNLLQNKEKPILSVNQHSPLSVKFNNSMIDENLTSFNTNDNVVRCRNHVESKKLHRFSGTLFEIYSRSRGQLLQSKSSHELFDLSENKVNEKVQNKILFNFGAQFPPTNGSDFTFHQKSNSFLVKKIHHYPKLGLIKTPKLSRLAHSAFLSKTLPDLSFLNKSDNNKQSRNNIPKICDSHHVSLYNKTLKDINQLCSKCSASYCDIPVVNDLIILDDNNESEKLSFFNQFGSVPNFQSVDLLTGSPLNREKRNIRQKELQSSESEMPLKSCLRPSLDRSVSEPDFNNSKLSENVKCSDCNVGKNKESLTSSTSDFEANKGNKAKKSVSFSEKKFGNTLSPKKCYGSSISLGRSETKISLKPQEIPRDWGLYGSGSNSTMVSEFVLGAQSKPSAIIENELSTENIKYKVMVQDIIKTIKETIVNCSDHNRKLDESKAIKPQLFIADPLYTLLTDGILPYQKNAISNKSRYRLWNVIESSCTNVDEYMVEIMKSVKKVPITNEKKRFKIFISHLIDAKLLQKWLKSLVNNENLLKNNYCKDSFLRQATNNFKGLYADLEINLQSLDSSWSSFEDWMKSSSVVLVVPAQCGETVKEKSTTNPHLLTSVSKNSRSKQNSIQPSASFNKSQELKKSKSLRSETTETDMKSVTKSSIRSNPKTSVTTIITNQTVTSSSFSSSIPDFKKPTIYYPRYQVGKGKL